MADHDAELLARAVELSRRHMMQGAGGPFGAVIAREDGTVIAEGWNQVTSANDPTAHAEIVAIRNTCTLLQTFDLRGHVMYTSCEPCPMCLAAIFWARLERIVFANTRHDAAGIGFDDAMIYDQVSKPSTGRIIRCEHIPSREARGVFEEWQAKSDKVAY